MIKESIHQKDIMILNMYVPNNKALKYTKQKMIELKGGLGKSIFIFEDCNTPLSVIGIVSRQIRSI